MTHSLRFERLSLSLSLYTNFLLGFLFCNGLALVSVGGGNHILLRDNQVYVAPASPSFLNQ